jgi:hypothetical protein
MQKFALVTNFMAIILKIFCITVLHITSPLQCPAGQCCVRSSGMLRHVTFVRTEVLEERIASNIKVKISELRTTLPVTNK